MQHLWYRSATSILNILTDFAEFAVATMITPIVKASAEQGLSNPNMFLIARLIFKIFLTSIIYIPVNNLVIISSLSSEKESLFWITRQLTLKVGLIYADFSYHLYAFTQSIFLVNLGLSYAALLLSILTVTDLITPFFTLL